MQRLPYSGQASSSCALLPGTATLSRGEMGATDASRITAFSGCAFGRVSEGLRRDEQV